MGIRSFHVNIASASFGCYIGCAAVAADAIADAIITIRKDHRKMSASRRGGSHATPAIFHRRREAMQMTVEELQGWLRDRGIAFTKSAKKNVLVELYARQVDDLMEDDDA